MLRQLIAVVAPAVGVSQSAAAMEPRFNRLNEERKRLVSETRETYRARARGGYSCELKYRGDAEKTLADIQALDARVAKTYAEAVKAEAANASGRQKNYYLTLLGAMRQSPHCQGQKCLADSIMTLAPALEIARRQAGKEN